MKEDTVKQIIRNCTILGLFLMLFACSQPEIDSNKTTIEKDISGVLEIMINNNISRAMNTGLDITPETYLITCNGPEGKTINLNTSNASILVDVLTPGRWNITCFALNKAGKTIGSGTGITYITKGRSSILEISVQSLAGTGGLSLTIEWPSGIIEKPRIVSRLIPYGGPGTTLNFDMTSDNTTDTADCLQENIVTGYHTLTVKLYDDMIPVSGTASVIHIIKDMVSTGTIKFNNIGNNEEELYVKFDPYVDNKPETGIKGLKEITDINEAMPVTAFLDESGKDVLFSWYIDGEQLEIGTMYNIRNIPIGKHRLDLTAYSDDGKFASTVSRNFSIVDSGISVHTLSGTIKLPGPAQDKKWYVIVDNDHDSNNGFTAVTNGVISGGAGYTLPYSIPGIKSGNYYIYAGIDINPDSGPDNGDFTYTSELISINDDQEHLINLHILNDTINYSGIYSYTTYDENSSIKDTGTAYLTHNNDSITGEIEITGKNIVYTLEADITDGIFNGVLSKPNDQTGYGFISGTKSGAMITGGFQNKESWGNDSGSFEMTLIPPTFGYCKVINSFPCPADSTPHGLTFDGANIWVNAREIGEILKLDIDGNILSSFKSPGPSPTGLTYDGTYLWYTDDNTLLIYQVDTDGTIINMHDAPGKDSTGLTFDGDHLYNTDFSDHGRIHKLDTFGNLITSYKSPANGPEGLAFGGDYFYHVDYYENKIYKLHKSMNVVKIYRAPGTHPIGLTYDGTYLWLADEKGAMIYQMLLDATSDDPWDNLPYFNDPIPGRARFVYIANEKSGEGDANIIKISNDREVEVVAGGFKGTSGLTYMPEEKALFISDDNNQVYKLDRSGDIDIFPLSFTNPDALSLDNNSLLVAESGGRISRVDLNGSVYEVLGEGFCLPRGIDSFENTIYFLDCNGYIYTIAPDTPLPIHESSSENKYMDQPVLSGANGGFVVDRLGNIYCSNKQGKVIKIAYKSKEIETIFSMEEFECRGLSLSPDENYLFVTGYAQDIILIIDLRNNKPYIFMDNIKARGLLNGPFGITVGNTDFPSVTYNKKDDIAIKGIYAATIDGKGCIVSIENNKWYWQCAYNDEDFEPMEAGVVYYDNMNEYCVLKYSSPKELHNKYRKITWRRTNKTTVNITLYTPADNYEDALFADDQTSGTHDLLDIHQILPGTWMKSTGTDNFTLTFDENGNGFELEPLEKYGTNIEGRYSLNRDNCYFTGTKTECGRNIGVYAYSLSPDFTTLTFTTINDGCDERKPLLAGTWKRFGIPPTPIPAPDMGTSIFPIYSGETLINYRMDTHNPLYPLDTYDAIRSAEKNSGVDENGNGAWSHSGSYIDFDFEISEPGFYKILLCLYYKGSDVLDEDLEVYLNPGTKDEIKTSVNDNNSITGYVIIEISQFNLNKGTNIIRFSSPNKDKPVYITWYSLEYLF